MTKYIRPESDFHVPDTVPQDGKHDRETFKFTIYTSASQPLWDRGLVNPIFIRRGPGPNRLTRKHFSIFLSSYIKLT